MAAEAEQVGKGRKSAWKMLFAGFLCGVLASLLVLVVLALKYGPRGESVTVDLYSGHTVIYRHFLWKHSEVSEPNEAHVRWAVEHLNPVRSWYKPVCGTGRAGWFEDMLSWDTFRGDWVLPIYSLKLSEEEKVTLLHQYHEELDAMKLKEKEYYESSKFMERFHKDWEQRLKSYRQQ
jgi:hypothetical protein